MKTIFQIADASHNGRERLMRGRLDINAARFARGSLEGFEHVTGIALMSSLRQGEPERHGGAFQTREKIICDQCAKNTARASPGPSKPRLHPSCPGGEEMLQVERTFCLVNYTFNNRAKLFN